RPAPEPRPRPGERAGAHPRGPRGRARQHRCSDRAHQGRRLARRGARGAAGALLAAGHRERAARARRRHLHAPAGAAGRGRTRRRGPPAVRRPGRGDHPHAGPPAPRARAGRDSRGKSATAVKDEDFVEKLFVAHTHDTVLCFSNRGKVYWLKVYELPQAGRGARGKPMVNLLPLEEGEKINALLPIKQYDEQHFVFMATRAGTVKKTALSAFSRPRSTGIIAVDLHDN